ncbi:polypeptide N-acetylgalactosaminyltransferase 4-like [Ylistrum balloti]|uniref:polypeptide N-acetylgalactosaminyltransferase 4-like n=1 Tax=Ylistrum balloti TaxID=509963 RepID=UPI002905DC8B|nr:polypeptide N-acetylgalactosaminyltransferase 4-like [Ylistrum balloti]
MLFLRKKFHKKLQILIAIALVLSWTLTMFWIAKAFKQRLTYEDALIKVSPTHSSPSDFRIIDKSKINVGQTLRGENRLNEYGRNGIKDATQPRRFSDIIKEFNISLYKDTSADRFHINVNKTHNISVNREVIDTRPAECASVKYNILLLPRASIVIPVYNEPWSTLERLINSVLKHSPRSLIHEIMIIDDQSDLEHLGAPLDKYVEQFDFMHLYRSKERLGTMKSRMFGTKKAEAEVIVFLDSHTEVNSGWLEPILYEISVNKTAIVQPSIDVIDAQTFEYRKYFDNNRRGHFRWNMGYHFVPLHPKQQAEVIANPTKAFDTPAIVGCAFAVNRKYFTDIGGLDTDMRTWGGEDVELSIRVWLCGGSMKISPCSHVAHIFKAGHPFKMDYSDLVYNNRRTAELWLGNYKKYFYYFSAGFAKPPDPSDKFDIMDPVKEKFKCKDFGWFLRNVFPELEVPPAGSEYFGNLRNSVSGQCFGLANSAVLLSHPLITTAECYFYYQVKNFALLENGRLMVEGKCVKVEKGFLVVAPCSTRIGKWSLKDKKLMYAEGSQCAMQVPKEVKNEKLQVIGLVSCNKTDNTSEWEIATKIFKGS